MNTYNRLSFFYLLTGIAFCIALTIASNIANAATCFDNAQSAYRYLLKQEQLQTQADTQVPININRATEAELTLLRGIGSSKAQAIILYREMFGDFKTVEDLAKVKGIGPKTIENNRTRLQVRD